MKIVKLILVFLDLLIDTKFQLWILIRNTCLHHVGRVHDPKEIIAVRNHLTIRPLLFCHPHYITGRVVSDFHEFILTLLVDLSALFSKALCRNKKNQLNVLISKDKLIPQKKAILANNTEHAIQSQQSLLVTFQEMCDCIIKRILRQHTRMRGRDERLTHKGEHRINDKSQF